MDHPLHIALLLGGPSAERQVSLLSGEAVAQALEASGHRVTRVDPEPGSLRLPPGADVVFIALHGTYGEDGQVQAELELLGVPYTGCGVDASRLAFDKAATKRRFLELAIPTARFSTVVQPGARPPAKLSYPLVLKPNVQGSSVGLQFVDTPDAWSGALAKAMEHGDEILVEERIDGREVTVAVLAGSPLPVVEVRPENGRYDYQNKYLSGTTQYLCPAPFAPDETGRIQRTALKAFLAIGGRDYGRVDIIVRPDGEPVVLEVNTLPGMTATSLFPKAAAAAGMSFEEVCRRMIELAMKHPSCTA